MTRRIFGIVTGLSNFGTFSNPRGKSSVIFMFLFLLAIQYYSRFCDVASFLSEFLIGCTLCVFEARGDGRSFDKFGISQKGSPMDFSRAEVMEGCCSIKWKNVLFHHLSTFYKTMVHSLRFSTGFGTPPDFYVLLIASINLESLDRDRCNCQAHCHQNPPLSLYIPRVSPLSLHIPHIFP